MLNITVAAAPAQPNQITLFFLFSIFFLTSAASQHSLHFQARHHAHADSAGAMRTAARWPWFYVVLLEFLYKWAAFMWYGKKWDGFSREGSWLIRAIGIKEGPAINGGDVREPGRSIMQASRGDVCQRVQAEFTYVGVEQVWRQSERNAEGWRDPTYCLMYEWHSPDRIVSPMFA